jgi:hypothetical protein
MPPPSLPTDTDPSPEHKEGQARDLRTVVLRAGMFALLKCCDAAWREMTKTRVFEVSTAMLGRSPADNRIQGEDWQAEKCEVSLLEGVPYGTAVRMLDDAITWINASDEGTEDSVS